ncbi:uncharacterized protein LOC132624527 [Lycium barbarum]|uniref:uncharacterized protein LOC132624527 n=1 Tax=Lycium barbarum TaxID=112863 RepID=UPI00293EC42C|nr:uncharacterized protein LOC132624527 [Lycium barbarum]
MAFFAKWTVAQRSLLHFTASPSLLQCFTQNLPKSDIFPYKKRYGNANVWKIFTDLFDYFPLTALVNLLNGCVMRSCVKPKEQMEANPVMLLHGFDRYASY